MTLPQWIWQADPSPSPVFCLLCLCLWCARYLDRFLTIGPFFPFLSGSILKKLLHTGNSFKVSLGLTLQDGKNHHLPNTSYTIMLMWMLTCKIWLHTRSNLAFKSDSTVITWLFPNLLLSRSAVRGSVSTCCGCRPWGTTVLRSSSLSLPVWCQDSLLCPPPEGRVPLTPSFTTPSPAPLMVKINPLWIY